MNPPFEVGEIVYDDLTRTQTVVIGIAYEHGVTSSNRETKSMHCWGIWVENTWMDGARHPWELTKVDNENDG